MDFRRSWIASKHQGRPGHDHAAADGAEATLAAKIEDHPVLLRGSKLFRPVTQKGRGGGWHFHDVRRPVNVMRR